MAEEMLKGRRQCSSRGKMGGSKRGVDRGERLEHLRLDLDWNPLSSSGLVVIAAF